MVPPAAVCRARGARAPRSLTESSPHVEGWGACGPAVPGLLAGRAAAAGMPQELLSSCSISMCVPSGLSGTGTTRQWHVNVLASTAREAFRRRSLRKCHVSQVYSPATNVDLIPEATLILRMYWAQVRKMQQERRSFEAECRKQNEARVAIYQIK